MNNKIISLIFTGVVIALLVASTPASAISVEVKPQKEEYDGGSAIDLDVSINIQNKELVPLQDLSLIIMKDKDTVVLTCDFELDGSEDCDDISITPVHIGPYEQGNLFGKGFGSDHKEIKTDFGFGYGYGPNPSYSNFNGELLYKVTWSNASAGKYWVKAEAYAKNGNTEFTYVSKASHMFKIEESDDEEVEEEEEDDDDKEHGNNGNNNGNNHDDEDDDDNHSNQGSNQGNNQGNNNQGNNQGSNQGKGKGK